jgi:hypothetical protein
MASAGPCRESGWPFASRRAWGGFCSRSCRDAFNNRRLRRGRQLALGAAAADEFTPLLGLIVYDMMRRPRTHRVITGFMQTISEHAVAHYAELNRGAS